MLGWGLSLLTAGRGVEKRREHAGGQLCIPAARRSVSSASQKNTGQDPEQVNTHDQVCVRETAWL